MALYTKVSKRVARYAPWMGPPVTRAHAALIRRSGGRIGTRFVQGARLLVIGTVGRRTGRRRETPLIYIRDGNSYVVGASNGGAAQHPAWYLNLIAAGWEAEVRVKGELVPVRAHVVEDAGRERLWRLLMAEYDGYDEYQEWTGREIPVVVLTPRA